MRDVDASLADIYIFFIPLQKNSAEKNLGGIYSEGRSCSLTDNISSNGLSGDQLKHGIFPQITPFMNDFNMEYSFLD